MAKREIQPYQDRETGALNYWRRIDQIEIAIEQLDQRLKAVERTLSDISAHLRGR